MRMCAPKRPLPVRTPVPRSEPQNASNSARPRSAGAAVGEVRPPVAAQVAIERELLNGADRATEVSHGPRGPPALVVEHAKVDELPRDEGARRVARGTMASVVKDRGPLAGKDRAPEEPLPVGWRGAGQEPGLAAPEDAELGGIRAERRDPYRSGVVERVRLAVRERPRRSGVARSVDEVRRVAQRRVWAP